MSSAAQRPGGSAGRPGLLDVLREGPYRRLWVSGLCLSVARWMDMIVLGWLALAFTGSPFKVALAAFVRAVPMMALGPFAGLVADRVPRGRVLAITQSLGVATALTLAAVFGAGRGGYWPLVALSGLFGVLWALDFPARRTALYALVGPGRVASAVSLETVSMQVAKIVGPVLAGIGLARMGPAACFVAIAALYGVGLAVSRGLGARIGGPARPAVASVAAGLGAGFRAAWREPTVRAVLIITVLMNVLFFPYQHMLPVFARDVLASGPEGLGFLVAADGLGALAGALVIASRGAFLPHRRLFAGAVIVAPGLLLALSASRWRWTSAAILFLMGAAESGFATMQSTLVLLSAPEHARGGAMGILSACIGTQPLGTLLVGFVASATGVAAAMAAQALVAFGAIVPLARALARRASRGSGSAG